MTTLETKLREIIQKAHNDALRGDTGYSERIEKPVSQLLSLIQEREKAAKEEQYYLLKKIQGALSRHGKEKEGEVLAIENVKQIIWLALLEYQKSLSSNG